MNWRASLAALMGVSAYALPPSSVPSLGDQSVETVREAYGGQLQPPPLSQTRWYLSHVEAAEREADTGILATAARLMRSARKDGVLSGVLSTRTAGLVRLPKRFRGDPKQVDALQMGGTRARSVFDEMFPAAELALLAADGELLGVGVAEMMPVAGRAHPVMVRLDPEFLMYRWNENRWYFRSIAGLLPITPGDGRWILHIPGGRNAPWQAGLWRAVARAFVRKEHAALHRDNWEAKLANPARVAIMPQGASEPQKQGWFQKVMGWGVNTVFGAPPGYDVKLLESNGKGADSFNETIADMNREMIIAVAGQTVTTDGGAGFQNSDIHKAIRADLIKSTADGLAYTLNTQGLPPWVAKVYLDDTATDDEIAAAIAASPVVEWDVSPPRDRKAEADALLSFGQALVQLSTAGVGVDIDALASRFGLPLADNVPAAPAPARLPVPGSTDDAAKPAARRRLVAVRS